MWEKSLHESMTKANQTDQNKIPTLIKRLT